MTRSGHWAAAPGVDCHSPSRRKVLGFCTRRCSPHGVNMQRREFITFFGSAVAAWPIAARAQRADQVRRIAWLGLGRADEPPPYLDSLRSGLRELGWIEGRNLTISVLLCGAVHQHIGQNNVHRLWFSTPSRREGCLQGRPLRRWEAIPGAWKCKFQRRQPEVRSRFHHH
jgi:hypothetical protein